jgi:hypothetical protein
MFRIGLVLVAGWGLAVATPAQQVDERVSISIDAEPIRPVVGQEVRVTMRIEVDDAFLRAQVIQPFRQPLDVPLQVLAPWWSGDGRIRPLPSQPEEGVRMAVDGQASRARALGVIERSGRRFAAFLVERVFRAEAMGAVELAPTTLRLAYATRWRDDFLAGRVPEDRVDLDVTAPKVQLDVRSLPDEGRPADFTGAVGRFTVAVTVEPDVVAVGGTLRWIWTVRGAGNLEAFTVPSAPALDGFHVLGRLEERQEGARVFVLELSALRPGALGLPPVAFGYFDPDAGEEGAFATAVSEALAVTVIGQAAVESVEPVAVEREPAGDAPASVLPTSRGPHPLREAAVEPAPGIGRQTWLLTLASAWVLAGIAWCIRAAADAAKRRRTRLGARFEAGLRHGRGARDLLVELVAEGMGWQPAAVLRPDLGERLVVGADVPRDLADELVAVLDACTAMRHGGTAVLPDPATLRALGGRLAILFETRRGCA